MFPRTQRMLFCFVFLTTIVIINFNFFSYTNANDGLEWTKYFGGNGNDILHSALYTSDNNFLLIGESNSFTNDDYDIYIAKVNQNGGLIWNITHSDLNLSEDDAAYQGIETQEGYILTGKIATLTGIGDDIFILKLNKNGNKIWCKTIGGNSWDWGNDLIQLSDGSILVVATTQDFFGSPYDPWLLKFDCNGNEMWKKRYKSTEKQYPCSIITDTSQNIYILGTTTNPTNTESNIFLLKTDSSGKEIWYKEYGGPEKETASKIVSFENGFIIAGTTTSIGAGRKDIYVIQVDKNGNQIWQTTTGSASDESAENIAISSDQVILTDIHYLPSLW